MKFKGGVKVEWIRMRILDMGSRLERGVSGGEEKRDSKEEEERSGE
jgi:hypothetical protein